MASYSTLNDAVTTVLNQTIVNEVSNLASSMYTEIMTSLINLDISQFPKFNQKNAAVMRYHMARNDVQRALLKVGSGQNAYANGDPGNDSRPIPEFSYSIGHTYSRYAKNIHGMEDSGKITTRKSNDDGSITNKFFDYDKKDASDNGKLVNVGQVEFSGTVLDRDSMLYKTRQLFNANKIKSIISQFHTKDVKYPGQIGSKAFGESHGRNLLTKEAEEKGTVSSYNGYDDPYCRVWTHHYSYDRLSRTIRSRKINGDVENSINYWGTDFEWKANENETNHSGDITKYGEGENYDYAWRGKHNQQRRMANSVLNEETGLVNIAPKYLGKGGADGGADNIHTKSCMFSIENLAWKDYDPYAFEQALSWEQRGPLGGRIMWFPPYNLKVTETNTAKWNQHEFIGRGEPVYTYSNSERTGTLTFTMLVDHPSSIDYASWHDDGYTKHSDNDYHRYFAGCFDGSTGTNGPDNLIEKPQNMTDEYIREFPEEYTGGKNVYKDKPDPVNNTYKKNQQIAHKAKVKFYVFFPNNYSGCYDKYGALADKNSENKTEATSVDPILYLLFGHGAQCKEDYKSVAVNISDDYNGYEMVAGEPLSYNKNTQKLDEDWKINYRATTSDRKTVRDKPIYYRVDHYFTEVHNGQGDDVIPYNKTDSLTNTVYQRLVSDVARIDSQSFGLNSSMVYYKQNAKITNATHTFAEFAYCYYFYKGDTVIADKIYENYIKKDNTSKNRCDELKDNLANWSCVGIKCGGVASPQGWKEQNNELAKNRSKTLLKWVKEVEKFTPEADVNDEPGVEQLGKKSNSNVSTIDMKVTRCAYIELTFNTTKLMPISRTDNITMVDDSQNYKQPEPGEFDETYWVRITPNNVLNCVDTKKYQYSDVDNIETFAFKGGKIDWFSLNLGVRYVKQQYDEDFYYLKEDIFKSKSQELKYKVVNANGLPTDGSVKKYEYGYVTTEDKYYQYNGSTWDVVNLYKCMRPSDGTEGYFETKQYTFADNDFIKPTQDNLIYYDENGSNFHWGINPKKKKEFNDFVYDSKPYDKQNGGYKTDTAYKQGDIVKHNMEYYICRMDFYDGSVKSDNNGNENESKYKKQSDYSEYPGFIYQYSKQNGDETWDYYTRDPQAVIFEQSIDNSKKGASIATSSEGDKDSSGESSSTCDGKTRLTRQQIIDFAKVGGVYCPKNLDRIKYETKSSSEYNQLTKKQQKLCEVINANTYYYYNDIPSAINNHSRFKGVFNKKRLNDNDSYSKDGLVIHNGQLYKCKNDISSTQSLYPWDKNQFVKLITLYNTKFKYGSASGSGDGSYIITDKRSLDDTYYLQQFLNKKYTYKGAINNKTEYDKYDVVYVPSGEGITTPCFAFNDAKYSKTGFPSDTKYWEEISEEEVPQGAKIYIDYEIDVNNFDYKKGIFVIGPENKYYKAIANCVLEYDIDNKTYNVFKSNKGVFKEGEKYKRYDVVYKDNVAWTLQADLDESPTTDMKWDAKEWTEIKHYRNELDSIILQKLSDVLCIELSDVETSLGCSSVDYDKVVIYDSLNSFAKEVIEYGNPKTEKKQSYQTYYHDCNKINVNSDLSRLVNNANIEISKSELKYIDKTAQEWGDVVKNNITKYIAFYQILSNTDIVVGGDGTEHNTSECTDEKKKENSETLVPKTETKEGGACELWVDKSDGILRRVCDIETTERFTIKSRSKEYNKLRYDQEYYFYKQYMEDHPFQYNKLKEKIRYFNPVYHSMTPEGFNGRLTFLNQCTRQGNTMTRSDMMSGERTANNLAFGRPPFCVLRLGDFYYQMIVIDSINYNYDVSGGLQWDLNPEGNGVQPMLCEVSINFKFIGGGDITGPVRRLQNAMSFNYYANTSFYDNRADRVEYEKDEKTMGGAGHNHVLPNMSSAFDSGLYVDYDGYNPNRKNLSEE